MRIRSVVFPPRSMSRGAINLEHRPPRLAPEVSVKNDYTFRAFVPAALGAVLVGAFACSSTANDRRVTGQGGSGGENAGLGGEATAGSGSLDQGGSSAAFNGGAGGSASGGSSAGGSGGTKAVGGSTGGGVGGTAGRSVTVGGAAGMPPIGNEESWLVSENFETGKIDPMKWNEPLIQDGTSLSVQSDVNAHGRYALRVFVPAVRTNGGNNATAMITLKKTPAALNGNVFLRMYFRFDPAPNFKNIMYKSDGGYTAFGTYSNNGAVLFAGVGGSEDVGNKVVAGNKWICLEARWETSPFRITLFTDGVENYSRTGSSSGGFNNITIGFQSGHAPEYASTLYIDDFAMDTRRIGCL